MLPFNQLSFWELETYLKGIDFLILGSGIVGLSTAIELKEKYPSRKIVILERGYLPTGASTKNAGFACFGGASELVDDLSHIDELTVFQTLRYRWEGLQILRKRLGDDAIQYDPCGSYDLFRTDDKTNFEKCLDQVPYLNKMVKDIIETKEDIYSVAQNQFGFNDLPYLIKNQFDGKIDTGKMMKSLVQLAQSKGIIILNGIEVKDVFFTAKERILFTNYGEIQAKTVFFCTNGLSKRFFPQLDIQPARAQVIITSPIKNLKWNSTFHFDKGYYYFRNIGNRILLGGARNKDFEGETTETIANSSSILSELENVLKTMILPNESYSISHQWAGIMGVGKEKMPIIQKLDNQVFCAIRLGGMGVAMGSKVAKELVHLATEN